MDSSATLTEGSDLKVLTADMRCSLSWLPSMRT
jgi:hypothetical protein